jgi:hypothetical protein
MITFHLTCFIFVRKYLVKDELVALCSILSSFNCIVKSVVSDDLYHCNRQGFL